MSLKSIAQTLHDEAQNGLITIDDTLLGSGTAFRDLVKSALLRTQGNILLSAKPEDIPTNPSGQEFMFEAAVPTSAGDGFLNLPSNVVSVTISEVNGAIQVRLDVKLSQLSNESSIVWLFSNSFPNLYGWPYDKLVLRDQQFIFIYAPEVQPDGLAQGLNFNAPLDLSGLLGSVLQLLDTLGLSATPLPLAGAITNTPDGPSFNLKASLGIPAIDLGALQIQSPYVGASMYYVRPPEDKTGPFEPMGTLYIGAETDLVIDSKNDVPGPENISLSVSFDLPLSGKATSLTLTILPIDKLSTNLNNIGQWMAGDSWNNLFDSPGGQELLPYLQTFGLKAYTLTIGLGKKISILSTSLSVGTLAPWTVLDNSPSGKIVMPEFYVNWLLVDPFGTKSSMISLGGKLDLFGSGGTKITFSGAITLPQLQLTFGLDAPQMMTAAEWLQTIIDAFGGTQLPDDVKEALSSFSLKTLLLDINQSAKSMSFQMSGQLDMGGRPVPFDVYLSLDLLPQVSYSIKMSFVLGTSVFKGAVSKKNNETMLEASWRDDGCPIGINSIGSSLGFTDLGIPIEFDLNIRSVSLAYNFTNPLFVIGAQSANFGSADIIVFKSRGAGPVSYLFFGGLNIDKPISLSNLPLVGKALSSIANVEIRSMKAQVASAVLSKEDAGWLNNFISQQPNNLPQVPPQGMASTVNLSMSLSIGDYVVPLGIGAGGQSATNLPAQQSAVQGPPAGNLNAPVPSTPAAQSDGTTWFNVEKAIGPVTFRRIGVKYKENVLWFLLDASFIAGGLTIDLLGMSIGSPISSFSPQFQLNGLGLSFAQGPFEMGGTFLKVPVKEGSGIDFEYAGGVVIKTSVFALTAYGDYASMSGTPSMFIFGQVTGKFGGPPAFFVTGLAAGFGYNTSVRIPAFNEVYKFPLVAGAQDPSVIGGKDATPAQVLNILLNGNGGQPWVKHEIGQYWFAAGIQFTTYTLVTTNALLIAQFGKRLQFALVGLSRAQFPPANSPIAPPPSGGLPVRYAFVELQVQTVYDVDQGVFSLTAVLSPNSYLLDPTCKLTGGFAFFMWFAPSNFTGDFVLTLGGYHPSFSPPKHYPQIPKVGFSWSLDSTVSITGTAYFALTPSAIMAGGGLSVTYQSGKLKAWFKAWANMLIYFSPFHFNFDMGITVGASYTMDLWVTTATVTIELGATLKLWGPRTGGTVTVYWWIISFTVNFGDSETKNLPALKWAEFRKSLLPEGNLVKFVPAEGLQPTGKTDLSDAPWLVRPAGLTFSTAASVPGSSLTAGEMLFVKEDNTGINIRPMQVTNLVSQQEITMTRDGVSYGMEGWTISPKKENVGKALWGTGAQNQLDQGNDQLVRDQLVGFDVAAPSPVLGATPGQIDVKKNLRYALLEPQGVLPIQPGQLPQGPIATQSKETIRLIEQEIAELSYAHAREELFNNLLRLGIDPQTNEDMFDYKLLAGELFADEPLLIPGTN